MRLYENMKRLEEIRGRVELAAIFTGGGIILFFLIMMISQSPIGMIVALGITLAGIPLAVGTTKEYKAIYKEVFVERPLRENFENVFYAWKTGFDRDTVRSFRLCNMGNIYKSEDYLRACYKGINFEMSDVTIMQSTGKSVVTIFKGRIMVFDFPNKFIAPMRVYSKRFFSKNFSFIRSSEKVNLESVRFNRLFNVYSTNPHDTFYLLTPQFMESLERLCNMYPNIGMCFEGNRVIFGMNEMKNNAFDPDTMFSKLDYPAEQRNIQKDINDIKNIIEIIDGMTE